MNDIDNLLIDIVKTKTKLIRYCKRYGLKENFGQREVRNLQDKYANKYNDEIYDALRKFDYWCMNYEGEK
jgi:hypothetical protein